MEEIKRQIKSIISDKSYVPLDPKKMFEMLEIPKKKGGLFQKALEELEQNAEIAYTKKGKITDLIHAGLIKGIYSGTDKGYGFVMPEEKLESGDIFIPARYTLGALSGDAVVAKMTLLPDDGLHRTEGEIIKILKRSIKTLTGVVKKGKSVDLLIPDNKKYSSDDIYILKKISKPTKNNDKVACEIVRYPGKRERFEVKVTHVFGSSKEIAVNIRALLYGNGIEDEFSEKVVNAAKGVPTKISSSEIKGRRDLREYTTFTIDGPNSKDFDDAVSIEKLPDGGYYLGVHIADVSHYVRLNDPIDQEAYRRGTSIYFADKVIPMLPFELSNEICSLKPDEDRLALSVFMTFDKKGILRGHEFYESVITSKARLVYSDVSDVLAGNTDGKSEKYLRFKNEFFLMSELSDILEKNKKKRGSLDFDFPEAKIITNEKGYPIDVQKRERGVSDRIIEQFMTIANEVVAEEACKCEYPFVYRIHENPDPEKIRDFARLASNLGYELKGIAGGQKVQPKMLQAVIEELHGKKEEKILSSYLLRSLMKAKYSESNLGHFGLAAKYYCHFTSPIRRYPDLFVHRVLKSMIKREGTKEIERKYKNIAAPSAQNSSETELNAVNIERTADDIYKAFYMAEKIGEEYDSIISSVASFGLFCELENTIEGFVHITMLDDDYYVFDRDCLQLVGERKGKTYRVGDEIKVKVDSVDLAAGKINFSIV